MKRHRVQIALNLSFMVFVCLWMNSSASAGLVADQQNDIPCGTSVGCGTPTLEGSSILQTFTPSVSTLDAVRLKLRAGGDFPSNGYPTSIMVRSGLGGGDVLGSATSFVSGPETGTADVYFVFNPPLPLTPGAMHTIEWFACPDPILTWMRADDGNPHPGGCPGYQCAPPDVYYDEEGPDLIFATYYMGPDTEGPITSKVLAAPNPVLINGSVTLTAKVDDSTTGNANIASAEYSLDFGSTWTPMDPQDGAFDGATEYVVAMITAPSVVGSSIICVRGTDALGNVGNPADIALAVYEEGGGVKGCVFFEDYFDDGTIGPGWSQHFSTKGWAYEKTSEIGSFLMLAADGADIWTSNDEYGSVYRSVEGDFDAIVGVLFQDPMDSWSKAGIGVRNDMSQAGSPGSDGSLGYAGIFVTPDNGFAFQWDAGGGMCGTSVSDLTRNPNYPDQPDGSESLDMMLWWGPSGDCYGQRISGWIKAPKQTTGGKYVFRIASDDNSELRLSTDDTRENLHLIAQVPGWTARLESPPEPDPFQYDKYPEQYSIPVMLQGGGKLYYIEVLHKEGGQDDFLAVQWSGPGVSGWKYVKPFGYPSPDPKGLFVREWWTTDWGPDGFLDSNVNDSTASYPCWLKLSKRGTSFSGWYSRSSPNGPWNYVGGATLDNAQTLQDVGIMATSHSWGNVGYNGFDYFALLVPDVVPPEFQLQVKPTVLWPANHKMVEITPSWTVRDAVDPSPNVSLKSITMNEGDEKSTYDPAQEPKGDGNTTGDIQVDTKGRIFLRAERSGTGTGRVYTITYDAVDCGGNVTRRSAIVTVPHDQGEG